MKRAATARAVRRAPARRPAIAPARGPAKAPARATPAKARPRKPALTSEVRVCTQGGPFAGVAAGTVKRRADKMLAFLDLTGAELSVALVDDTTIHALNRDYRRKNKPTDVLAFAMEEGEPSPRATGARVLGDVIVSVETAKRQAAGRRRPLLDELTMLLAHGLLHLLGYDHQTDAQERVMVAKTRELEQAAGTRAAALEAPAARPKPRRATRG